jgi:hypothetical protein
MASNTVTLSAPFSNVWVDVYVEAAAGMAANSASLASVDSNMTVELFINTDGYVTVFNPELGSGQWDICSNDAQGAAVASLANDAWLRITINLQIIRARVVFPTWRAPIMPTTRCRLIKS